MKNRIYWENIRGFITSGKAIFAVTSLKTQNRFTFKVTQSSSKKSYYVKVLSGRDNENDYRYIGYIGKDDLFHASCTAPSAEAFQWLWLNIISGKPEPENIELRHEGRCGRCGRKLTVPHSIESGFGPECIGYAELEKKYIHLTQTIQTCLI